MPLQHIDTDGGSLALEVEGQGPLVVCAPCLGDFRDAYTPLAEQLVKQGYTVACMDVRGHGDSSAVFRRYGDEATADDFITIIEKLNRGPAVLIGASFSAGSATIAAGKRPDLVKGIVLNAPFLRLSSVVMFHMMPFMFAKPWGPIAWQSYAKTLWPGLGEQANERAKKSKAALSGGFRWPAFQATVAGLDHRKVEPWIPKAKDIPTLVFMGDKDPDWKEPLEEAKWVASNFSNVKNITVEGTGHAPHFEKPDVVGPELIEFLSKLKSSGVF